IDADRARFLPGVRAVLTDVHPTGNVRFAGEYVAAVAAVNKQVALDAVALIEVKWQTRAHVVTLWEAIDEDAPRVFADKDNVTVSERGDGDVDAGFSQAETIVEAEFFTQVQTHSPLETHGSVAAWDGDELTVWDSTQAVHGVREGLAKALEMPANKVRVICHHMGGGFGAKLGPGAYSVVAAKLARQAGAPVQLMLSRKDQHLSVGNRPDSWQQLKLGATKDGQFTAFECTTWGSGGIGGRGGVSQPYVYSFPAWKQKHHDVATNTGGARAFRAPGRPQACFAMEQIIDEMAWKLGLDPLEVRLRNDDNETRHEQWRIGAERIDWPRWRRREPGAGAGPSKRGVGMGASIWFTGGSGTKAQMDILSDGTVEVRCGTQDIGTGTRTLVAAVAAEELGLPIAAVNARIGDSDFPFSGGSGGSTTAPSVAPAIKVTAEKAKAELALVVARHLGVVADSLSFVDGTVRVASGQSLSWREACAMLGANSVSVQGEWQAGLSGSNVAGCQFAEVEVDTETGRISVIKMVAVADCGLIVDRLTTESQVNGAVIQGISYALLEERIMDSETGRMVNADFENYKILGALETPEIDVILYDQPERGVIGIGEPPTIPTSAAVANAVYHAIGVRLRDLPMTPDKVLRALEGA
ncbi:MAG: xanthine dehydrogenase family protein molybdopterin-binding subunit, partial [bacterium]|nr:xanthine dehydrogenase family protein molybdopterin-binding subunit [bacterium]